MAASTASLDAAFAAIAAELDAKRFVYSTVRGVSIQYRPVATRRPTLCTVTELSIKFTSCPVMSVTFCMFHQATGLRE